MASKTQVKRVVVAITLTLVLAVAGGGAVLLTRSGEVESSDASIAELRDKVVACLALDETNAGRPVYGGVVVECMNKLAATAKGLEDFPRIDAAFAAASKIDSRVDFHCHYSLHNLTSKVPVEQIPYAFNNKTTFSACTYAFVHGLLEQLGTSKPSDEIFMKMADACETLVSAPLREHCIHGFGHALWNAHQDLNDAVTWCTQDRGRQYQLGCTVAVYMEAYYPSLGNPARDIVADTPMLQAKCDGLVGEEYKICSVGVASAFLGESLREMSRTGDGLEPSPHPKEIELLKERLTTTAKGAIERCTTYMKPDQQGLCVAVSWRLMLGLDIWTARVDEAYNALCAAYPEPHVSECLATRKES